MRAGRQTGRTGRFATAYGRPLQPVQIEPGGPPPPMGVGVAPRDLSPAEAAILQRQQEQAAAAQQVRNAQPAETPTRDAPPMDNIVDLMTNNALRDLGIRPPPGE